MPPSSRDRFAFGEFAKPSRPPEAAILIKNDVSADALHVQSNARAKPANFDEAIIDSQLRAQEEQGFWPSHPPQLGSCRRHGR